MKKAEAIQDGIVATEHLLLRQGSFRHYGNKDHMGYIIFWEDKSVTVQWNRAAKIAADHGTGNRSVKATRPTGKRTPPTYDPLFEMIETCRSFADMQKLIGTPIPADPDAENVPKLLSTIFRGLAWQMVSAVLNGDSESLRRIAATIELSEYVRISENPSGKWETIAEAVRKAALKAGNPPTRKQVEEELGHTHSNLRKDLTGDLGRMGLGWLAQRNGRPREPGTKGG